jgi:23S rRNA (uracil1939-C5)-methyltransferase
LESAPLHPHRPSASKPRPTGDDSSSAGGIAADSAQSLRRGGVIDVDVEKLVFRGDGLARKDGMTVFIPTAAPGDRLRIRVTEIGRGFARGEILEVLQPGPARRDPKCRHFGQCGGCQLQHVDYVAQLDAKVGFVRESLRRLGAIDWTSDIPIRAAAEYGWRTRTEIQARRGHVGYFRAATHEIVDVAECPILAPAAVAFVLGLAADPPKSAVHVAVGDDGVVATGHGAVVRQRIADFDFEFGADSFFQANRLLVDELVREAVSGASGALAVDLYAGAGLFSLPLARTFTNVVAVETRGATVRRGEGNAARNGVTNVRFVADSAENWVTQGTPVRPDLVLLDPPRTGVGPRGAEEIAKIGAPAVTYVSCDPATLARDLQIFVALGYRLASVVALDMFPQTYHVETVAKLVR